jgi:hypothetical protein
MTLPPLPIYPNRSRSRGKSYPYPFRDIAGFLLTHHARIRMEERQVSIEDVALILQHGRALLWQKGKSTCSSHFSLSGRVA